jgi:hypothetical protein
MLIKILGAVTILIAVTGCQQTLEDFARLPRQVGNAIVPFEGQQQIKISPGATTSAGADVSMKAHVTITDRTITGSDVSARVSVGRNRPTTP